MKERELRLLLTQKCNFKCGFCHKEGVIETKKEILNASDYVWVYDLLKKWYGWNTISITGGEPLCRTDLNEILVKLYNSGAKITLITNGSILSQNIKICKWLEKLTVSVHTTNNDQYQKVIGVPFNFSNLVNNLKLVRKYYPKINIRFNATLVKGINSSENEILRIIKLAKKLEASIKFIELLPNTEEDERKFVSIEIIGKILMRHNYKLFEDGQLQKIYFNKGLIVVLAKIVCSVSRQLGTASPHCTTTNNVFLAADGTIKPCMKNSFEINVLKEIKNKDADEFKKR